MKDTYILNHIQKYGNCYISDSMYNKLGKTNIINYLKRHGYNCKIAVYKFTQLDLDENIRKITKDYIIEVIR